MVRFILIVVPGREKSATNNAIFESEAVNELCSRVVMLVHDFWKMSRDNQITLIRSILQKNDNIIVFVPSVHIPRYMPGDLIDRLKMEKSVSAITCFLGDEIDRMAHYQNMPATDFINEYLSALDGIYTYSIFDARKYGLSYIDSPLKKFDHKITSKNPKVFFIGREKGRIQILRDVGKYLMHHGITCEFLVMKDDKTKLLEDGDGVYFVDYIRYDEMIRKVQESTCLLGIVGEYISMPGLNFKESILYNKKFLTNAYHLEKIPHYDARYQKEFHKVEDIDIDWLKDKTEVQYDYGGWFDLKCFFDTIEKDFYSGHLRRMAELNRKLMCRENLMRQQQIVLYRTEALKFPARKGKLYKEDISSYIPYGYIPRLTIPRATGSNHLYFYFAEVDRLKNITMQLKNTSDEEVKASPSVWILCEKDADQSKYFMSSLPVSDDQDPVGLFQKERSALESRVEKLKRRLEKERNLPLLTYDVHVSKVGWVNKIYEGAYEGRTPIEAVRLHFSTEQASLQIATSTKKFGWSEFVMEEEISGSTGKSLPLNGICIKLDDAERNRYGIRYRVMWNDSCWSDWEKNGVRLSSDEKNLIGVEIELYEKIGRRNEA